MGCTANPERIRTKKTGVLHNPCTSMAFHRLVIARSLVPVLLPFGRPLDSFATRVSCAGLAGVPCLLLTAALATVTVAVVLQAVACCHSHSGDVHSGTFPLIRVQMGVGKMLENGVTHCEVFSSSALCRLGGRRLPEFFTQSIKSRLWQGRSPFPSVDRLLAFVSLHLNE